MPIDRSQAEIIHINLAKCFRGGERQTILLMEQLKSMGGWSQSIILARGQALEHELPAPLKSIAVRRIPITIKGLRTARTAAVVHAHEARGVYTAWLVNRLYGIPYIITRRVDKPLKTNALTRDAYRRAFRVVCLSNRIQEMMAQYDDKVRLTRIPSAFVGFTVDEAQWRLLQQERGRNFVIGHLGALNDVHKGQSVLIEAVRILRSEIPELKLWLLGDGSDESSLRALAAGMSSIEFKGFIKNPGAHLASMDIFCFPSLQEGLGSALLDALNAGVAVVASSVGGIPDIIQHERNGLLVPSGDANALASAIKRLYYDRSLRDRLAETGRKDALGYTPEVMAESYDVLYRAALTGR